MRIRVDLVNDQVKALEELAKADQRSRAALLRDAVDAYLSARERHAPALDDAFGLWGNRGVDGLAYQKRLRGEW